MVWAVSSWFAIAVALIGKGGSSLTGVELLAVDPSVRP